MSTFAYYCMVGAIALLIWFIAAVPFVAAICILIHLSKRADEENAGVFEA